MGATRMEEHAHRPRTRAREPRCMGICMQQEVCMHISYTLQVKCAAQVRSTLWLLTRPIHGALRAYKKHARRGGAMPPLASSRGTISERLPAHGNNRVDHPSIGETLCKSQHSLALICCRATFKPLACLCACGTHHHPRTPPVCVS